MTKNMFELFAKMRRDDTKIVVSYSGGTLEGLVFEVGADFLIMDCDGWRTGIPFRAIYDWELPEKGD